ncbi:hypothetical protein Hanom_Chr05g00442811 [Helianthus anomalus]
MLTEFKKWFYDGMTRTDFIIFDPMDVLMFCLSDFNKLYGLKIHVGAGNEYQGDSRT